MCENQHFLVLTLVLVILCIPVNSQCIPDQSFVECPTMSAGLPVSTGSIGCNTNQPVQPSCRYIFPANIYIGPIACSANCRECKENECCYGGPIGINFLNDADHMTVVFQMESNFIKQYTPLNSTMARNLTFCLCSAIFSAMQTSTPVNSWPFFILCQLLSVTKGSKQATMNLTVGAPEPMSQQLFNNVKAALQKLTYDSSSRLTLEQLYCTRKCDKTYNNPTIDTSTESQNTTRMSRMPSPTAESTKTSISVAAAEDSSRVIDLAVGLSIGIFAIIVVVVVICVFIVMRCQKKHTPSTAVDGDNTQPAEPNFYAVMPSAPPDESGQHQTVPLNRPGEVRQLPNNSSSNLHQQLAITEAEYRDLTVIENSVYEQQPTFDGSTSVPASRNTSINHAYDHCVTLIPGQLTTTQSNNVNVSSISTQPEDYIPRPSAEGHHNNPPIHHEYSNPVHAIPQ